MAKKEIAVKKYVVKLSGEERERLEALIHAGKGSANPDEGAHPAEGRRFGDGRRVSDSAVSAALDTSVTMSLARVRNGSGRGSRQR